MILRLENVKILNRYLGFYYILNINFEIFNLWTIQIFTKMSLNWTKESNNGDLHKQFDRQSRETETMASQVL